MTIAHDFEAPRILVAVDGSDRAAHVLEAALGLARNTRAVVTVLRVVGLPSELPPDAYALAPDALARRLVSDAEIATRELVTSFEVQPTLRVETGAAVPTILRVATEVDASLIVIGAHGYGFSERVLGTTAARVVDRATRSVLVVR